MEEFKYIDIGATLFIPATHKNLVEIVCNNKYPQLRSVLIDTEDGIKEEALDVSYQSIQGLLSIYDKNELLVFIRPRNEEVLKKLLEFYNIEKIDGFILPKFSLDNGKIYLDLLQDTHFIFMPSIEGKELFEQIKLQQLRELLLPFKKQIPLLRYGLEDMLRQLGMKRNCEESIFDYAVTAYTLGQFIAIFKSAGFAISGGVYPCFKDNKGFTRDIKRDLKEGLFGKTMIHPNQIEIVNDLYKVTQKEYKNAIEILESEEVVFSQNFQMAETKTMSVFAKEVVKRKEVYGLVE